PVGVIARPVDRDERDTGFHEPPRQQQTLTERIPTIAIAHRTTLLRQVECATRGRRTDQVKGPLEKQFEIPALANSSQLSVLPLDVVAQCRAGSEFRRLR